MTITAIRPITIAAPVEQPTCSRGCGQPVHWVFLASTYRLGENLCHGCADVRTHGWGARLGGV